MIARIYMEGDWFQTVRVCFDGIAPFVSFCAWYVFPW